MMRQNYFLSARYTQVPFYRKFISGPKIRVRYVEVSGKSCPPPPINRFYYKDLTVVPSVLAKSVLYIEMSSIKGVRYV